MVGKPASGGTIARVNILAVTIARLMSPAAASLLLFTSLAHAVDQFPADNYFVTKAEQAGNQEVLAATTALSKSRNPEVRRVAKALQLDGAAANRRLSTMAIEKGWPSPSLDPPEDVSDYSDHQFVITEIRAHKVIIDLYREEAATGADTDLQEFARNALRTLRRRLLALQSLRSS
jgi:predicted outer membrane protein